MIKDGSASGARLTSLRTGDRKPLLGPVTQAAMTGDPAILSEVSISLVAEREGRVVGELNAIAPTAFIGQLIKGGMDPARAAIWGGVNETNTWPKRV